LKLKRKYLSIQNDFEFQKTRDCLIALFKEGAKEGRDSGKNKSVFTKDQEEAVLSSYDITTPIGLLQRTLYILSMYGCFRGRTAHQFQRDWITIVNDNLGRKSINIHIPFDKNHQTGLTKCAEARNNIIPYEAEDELCCCIYQKGPHRAIQLKEKEKKVNNGKKGTMALFTCKQTRL
jgi:hypothetical protein